MKSSEYWPRAAILGVPHDERFERLRDLFYVRLCGDFAHLQALRDELGAAQSDPFPVFEKLRALAHRVAGAGGMFKHDAVRNAGWDLEQTLLDAISAHSLHDDPRVLHAIGALLELLPATSQDRRAAH